MSEIQFDNSPPERVPVSLYPLRASEDEDIDGILDEINQYVNGKEPSIKLDDADKKELLAFEDGLGAELEKLEEINVMGETIFLDYFLTENGRADLVVLFGKEINHAASLEELKFFFYKRRGELCAVPATLRSEVFGRAYDYGREQLFGGLTSVRNEEMQITRNAGVIPNKMFLNLKPEALREKITGLRTIKKKIKQLIQEVSVLSEANNNQKAKREILKMYLSKINQMIAEMYPALSAIHHFKNQFGAEHLDAIEVELLDEVKGTKDSSAISRLDKFIYGAAQEYQEDGNKIQVTPYMRERARVLSTLRSIEESDKKALVKENGIDPKKLLALEIDLKKRSELNEQVLKKYGLLSEEDSSTYEKDRIGKAKDSLWQYVPQPDRTTIAVKSDQKVILAPIKTKNENIAEVLLDIAHEIEGHVLQHENKTRIPLRLFQEVGGDRRHLFAEGGAMFNQEKMSQELFGYSQSPTPSYIAAMEMKLNGGDYIDAVLAYYHTSLASVRDQYDLTREVSRKNFKIRSDKLLKTAIKSCQRIFRGGTLDNATPFLANSKETVYLEQEIFVEKLAEKGLQKLAFIGGANLRNILTLLKLGMLNLDDIEEPKYYVREIWDSIKDQYTLDASSPKKPEVV